MLPRPVHHFKLTRLRAALQAQRVGLELRKPWAWPLVPQLALLVLVSALVLALVWIVLLQGYWQQRAAEQSREGDLRQDYQRKLLRSAGLAAVSTQRDQLGQALVALEKNLSGQAEQEALLSDINQAGLRRGLQFELLRPGKPLAQNFYAELPVAVRVVGRYQDMGGFLADVAALPHLVTLGNISLHRHGSGEGLLSLDGTVKTFRRLDPQELAAQAAANKKANQ